MVEPNKPLTLEEILASITDERAREAGYPNAQVYRLSFQLGNLAGEWRETKDDTVVQEYHKLFHELITLGWDPYTIAFDEMLPDELMPEFPEISMKHSPSDQE